jgi:hypothetical protein
MHSFRPTRTLFATQLMPNHQYVEAEILWLTCRLDVWTGRDWKLPFVSVKGICIRL